MRNVSTSRWWPIPIVCLVAVITIPFTHGRHSEPASLVLSADHDLLPADGYAQARIRARSSDRRDIGSVKWHILSGNNLVEIVDKAHDFAFRARTTPGDVQLLATSTDLKPARINIHLALDPTDQVGDGTPDFLRLQDQADRTAFRRWFTFLAESTYVQDEKDRPKEVTDCAALIRYAYREALHGHDGPWANSLHLSHLPSTASVKKYDFPHTAVGPNLFRTRPGSFTPDDLSNGAFAEFADAESLRRFNAHFVSRDLTAARPGDIIFFRQSGQRMPFHAMIYLGPSDFGEDQGDNWLIYHTGPDDKHAGGIRRVTIDDLMHHPDARWRPSSQNPAFLGVYRWNILREAD